MPHVAFIRPAIRWCPMAMAVTTLLAVAGCGAEAVGGAATAGALQAEQAKQARAQQAQIVDELKRAQEAGLARAASAAD